MSPARHALPAADAAWLHMDRPENLMVINSVLWFDAPLPFDALRDLLQHRLVERFPRFRQRIVETATGPVFEDDPAFDLELHVHHLALPAPGDQAALQEAAEHLIVRPLDRNRPLWEIYLFDGFGDGAAVLSRMHHCIADGIALARVLLSLTDYEDAAVRIAEPHTEHHGPLHGLTAPVRRAASTGASVAKAAAAEGFHTLAHPAHVADLARTAVQDAGTLAKLLLSPPDGELHGELGVPNRIAWSAPVPVQTVRDTAHALEVTINDLVVAAVAGALRRYVEEEPGHVHALVPFNLRPLSEPLDPRLGNQFGLILLDLPTQAAELGDRIAEAKRRMDAIKHSHEGPITYGVVAAMGMTPPAVEGPLIDFFSAKGTMVLTNVPGPREEVTFAGVPVAGILVWAPCSGSVPMSVSVLSYHGNITVGFLTDAGIVPDPQRLADGFRDELLAAAQLAGQPS